MSKIVITYGLDESNLNHWLHPAVPIPFWAYNFHCGSVESFYHSLKVDEVRDRRIIIYKSTDPTKYRRLKFTRPWYLAFGRLNYVGSIEHDALIKYILRGKIVCDKRMALEFANSEGTIEIKKHTGRGVLDDGVGFSSEMYGRVLTELREEIRCRYKETGLIGTNERLFGQTVEN